MENVNCFVQRKFYKEIPVIEDSMYEFHLNTSSFPRLIAKLQPQSLCFKFVLEKLPPSSCLRIFVFILQPEN